MIKKPMEVSDLEARVISQDGDGLLQREEFSQAVKQLLAEYQRVGCHRWVGGRRESVWSFFFLNIPF